MKALILLLAAAAVGAFGYAVFPDVRRYLSIRRM